MNKLLIEASCTPSTCSTGTCQPGLTLLTSSSFSSSSSYCQEQYLSSESLVSIWSEKWRPCQYPYSPRGGRVVVSREVPSVPAPRQLRGSQLRCRSRLESQSDCSALVLQRLCSAQTTSVATSAADAVARAGRSSVVVGKQAIAAVPAHLTHVSFLVPGDCYEHFISLPSL